MTPARREEREERDAVYEGIVSDPAVRALVYKHIRLLTGPGEPAVAPADIQAARHYLRACMANMSLAELTAKQDDDFAGLWARGALGSARYRVRHRPPPGRRAGTGDGDSG